MISINLIAGSGAYAGKGSWIFSGMAERIVKFADPNEFEIIVTEDPDSSRPYDIYHYLHSSLAVKHGEKLHRSLVTVVALDDIAPHRTFSVKEKTLHDCRRITTICRDVTESLIYHGIPEEKVDYTPIGVDLERFAPTGEDRSSLLERLGIKDHKGYRIGVIGRSYPDGRKGEKMLVDAISHFSYLINPDPMTVVFIGDWSDNSDIKDLYDSDVYPDIFIEHHNIDVDCSYEDYPDLYESLDGVIVTSKTESGPACILEALAKGLPVISTPGGMANEFLTRRMEDEDIVWDDERYGAVIPYGDYRSFAEAMKHLIVDRRDKNRDLSFRMKVSEVLAVPQHWDDIWEDEYPYSWENWSHRFQKIYRKMASEIEGKKFFKDSIGSDELKKIDDIFRQMVDSSLPDVYQENFLMTLDYSRRGMGLIRFGNVFKGKSAVIVGVGPSLNDHIELLREHQDEIVIVCCDAAIPVLTDNGIMPHVVVVADPSNRQIPNFKDRDCSGFLTVIPTVVHPMVLDEVRKSCKTAWYNIMQDGSNLCMLIPSVVGQKGGLIPGVLTTGMAMQVAMFMGCWPITFIGHDLGWYDVNGPGYVDGVDPNKVSWQRDHKILGGDSLIVEDVNGRLVTTEINFFTFVGWVNRYLDHEKLKIYNSSECGILYGENIIQMPFEEWVSKFATKHDAHTDLMSRYRLARQQLDTQCCHQYPLELVQEIRSL